MGRNGDASTAVNPDVIRDWAKASAEGLEQVRGEINDLNVFPIPDADTGSNMAFTMAGAAAAVEALPEHADLRTVMRAMAEGGVANARGNSGIILSQMLIGWADAADLAVAENDASFSRLCASGLRLAALSSRRAVSQPREGTVLTLLSVAADTAAREVERAPADLVRAIADDCAEALDRTTDQMIELANAGVVDAGARGFLVLLDAMVLVVTGVTNRRRVYRGAVTDSIDESHADCAGAGETDFEVMYVLSGADGTRIGELRGELGELGDSIVIVGDSSTDAERFSVHVHTDFPGEAVQAGLGIGQVSDIRISCFLLDELRKDPGATEPPPRFKRAVLVLAQGAGAEEIFTEAGAVVVRADHGVHPVTLSEKVRGTESAHTVVMGNGMVSSQDLVSVGAEARSSKRSVVFLPTLSMVQCLAALAVHDPAADADVDAFAMAEAAAGTRWGSLQRSVSKVMTLAGTCEIGDVLGLVGSDVLVIAPEQVQAATALIDLLLATGGEMVTILAGEGLEDGTREAIDDHLRTVHPGVELALYDGGQSCDLLQIGVE